MSPPKLATDAPIFDITHPFEVGPRPVLRNKLDLARGHGFDGGFGERRDFDVPLVRQIRLDHRSRTIAARHHQLVLVDTLEQALFGQFFDDACACLETIEPVQFGWRVFVDLCVGREDVDDGELMTLADFVVVEIVRRGDLHATGSELRINVGITDDRNRSIGQRQPQLLSDEMPIALIVRMHGNRGVAEHRLGAGRSNDEMSAAIRQWITQMPKRSVFFSAQHLEIRYGGLQHRIPVHQSLAAIDETFFVQAHEYFGYGLRETLIHREAIA